LFFFYALKVTFQVVTERQLDKSRLPERNSRAFA